MSFYFRLTVKIICRGYLSIDNFCPLMANALNNTAQGSWKPNKLTEGNWPIQVNEGWELHWNKTPILIKLLFCQKQEYPQNVFKSNTYFKTILITAQWNINPLNVISDVIGLLSAMGNIITLKLCIVPNKV